MNNFQRTRLLRKTRTKHLFVTLLLLGPKKEEETGVY
jgi:hypothetical protein